MIVGDHVTRTRCVGRYCLVRKLDVLVPSGGVPWRIKCSVLTTLNCGVFCSGCSQQGTAQAHPAKPVVQRHTLPQKGVTSQLSNVADLAMKAGGGAPSCRTNISRVRLVFFMTIVFSPTAEVPVAAAGSPRSISKLAICLLHSFCVLLL